MTTVDMGAERREGWLDRSLNLGIRVDAEVIIYVALLFLAVFSRFYDLESRVMSHDESLHTYYSWRLQQGFGYQHSPLMHGPMQFHLLAGTYFLFGDSDFTARIPAAVSGILAVGLLYFFRRWLGRSGAIIAAALMLVSPYMLYYSRYVRNEPLVVVEALLMFWAVFQYYESRKSKWLYLLALSLSLHYLTKETSFLYAAQLLIFVGALFTWRVLEEKWTHREHLWLFLIGLFSSASGLILAAVVYFTDRAGDVVAATPEAVQPLDPEAVVQSAAGLSPAIAIGGLLALLGVILIATALILNFGRRLRTDFPSLDVLLITLTMTLPLLGAVPANLLGWDPLDYVSTPNVIRTLIVVLLLAGLGVAIGLSWDWRRWLIAAGVFYVPYVVFMTTFFTSNEGIATGFVGSLGYWLVQHGVERGSQPKYYYLLVQIPLYEYLPLLGSMLAGVFGIRKFLSGRTAANVESAESGQSQRKFPALLMLGYWAITAFVIYSFAGERMPWLTVHITLPLILLAGWAFGRVWDAIDWRDWGQRRSLLLVLLIGLFLMTSVRALGILFGSQPPFAGSSLEQLTVTSGFITTVAIAIVAAIGLLRVGREWAWAEILQLSGVLTIAGLFLFTARAAARAAYLHYDEATEFLVYAHGARGVKAVMEQVEDLSRRTSDGLNIEVGYDDDVSWPMTWYLRNYTNQRFFGASPSRDILNNPILIVGNDNWDKVEPIVGNRYETFEYIRMVWPNQDYFNLNQERILTALTSPEYRQALWDIWLNRDYKRYAELTEKDMSLANWSPSDRMKLYVRKDIATLIWDYGVSPASLEPVSLVDPYEERMTTLNADQVFGSVGSEPGQFNEARDIAVGPDGNLYVADTKNHRIQKLSPDGETLLLWGSQADTALGDAPGGAFNEPWGIAVGPDGSVYVADTWNHRVQRFSADGEFLSMFGYFGQAETLDAFWGPRDVAVDAQGRVFVTDTGNKRIVVFDSEGNPLSQFGGLGVTMGYLDEPVGISVDGQGRVYVADTWNQRVQVFEEREGGLFEAVLTWPIDGWYGQSLSNKPYVAVSQEADQVCVSDPEGFRILCFNPTGEFQIGWGNVGQGENQFNQPSGASFDQEGGLWIVDSMNGRIMRFSPEES